jgi:hypothetical protein
MKKFKFFLIISVVAMVFAAQSAMAWNIDLSDSATDPYSLELRFLLDDDETLDMIVYQFNVIPTDGFVSATHTVAGAGMFSLETVTNEDGKIGDWAAMTFTTATLTDDTLFGTIIFDYEVTAGVDVVWGYEHVDFGGGFPTLMTGVDLFEAGHLSYNGVVASAVPVPAAVWLLGSGLLGLAGLRRRKR